MATTPMSTVVEIPPQQNVTSSEDVEKALSEGKLRRICIATIVLGCMYTIISIGWNIGFFLESGAAVLATLTILELFAAVFIVLPPSLLICCKCCNCCCNSQCPLIAYFVLATFGIFFIMLYSIDDFAHTDTISGDIQLFSIFMILLALSIFGLLCSGIVISGKILCGCKGRASQATVRYQQLGSVANPNIQVMTSPFPVVQNGSNGMMISSGSRDPQQDDVAVPDVVTSQKDTQFLITD